jgi:division protein CdvB (Snf7/Vps24/ESCRT-III family)
MLKDNKLRLSDIKRTAIKLCSRDEGKIENQQAVVDDLKSQLKMARKIRKELVLISEREEIYKKEKSRANDSNQVIRITKFNLC